MQNPPLLERLDWVLTNNSWALSYPETTCKALVMEVSDHSPLLISISTNIPKGHIFKFENYWLLRDGFQEVLTENWFAPNYLTDKAKILTSKFKNLRGTFKNLEFQAFQLKDMYSKHHLNSATTRIFGGIQRSKFRRMEF